MSWREITEDDVWSSMSEPEEKAVRTKLLTTGQSDPMIKIIEQVTKRCRTAIKSCKDNVLSEDASQIPDGIIFDIVPMIRYRLLGRLKLREAIGGDDLKDENKDAKLLLRDIARCIVTVDLAGAPEDEAAPQGMSPKIKARDRRFSRRQQEGI